MKLGVYASLLAILAIGWAPLGPAEAQGDRVRACMLPREAREVLIQERLVAPFRALGEAMRSGPGEVVGVQLCRLADNFVYDVTMLQREGRVVHVLIDARRGVPIVAARTGK